MTITTTLAPARLELLRTSARLLVLTLPAYLVYMAVAVATMPVKTSADLTPALLAEVRVPWLIMHVLWASAVVLAAVGLARLARALPRSRLTAPVPILAGVAVAAEAGYLVVQVIQLSSTAPSLGTTAWYAAGMLLSLMAGWLGVLPATILVTVSLARQGIARRTMWAIAILTTLYLLVELLAYLPILLGPAVLADMMGGLPPAVMGVLWAWMGSRLLGSRVGSPL